MVSKKSASSIPGYVRRKQTAHVQAELLCGFVRVPQMLVCFACMKVSSHPQQKQSAGPTCDGNQRDINKERGGNRKMKFSLPTGPHHGFFFSFLPPSSFFVSLCLKHPLCLSACSRPSSFFVVSRHLYSKSFSPLPLPLHVCLLSMTADLHRKDFLKVWKGIVLVSVRSHSFKHGPNRTCWYII